MAVVGARMRQADGTSSPGVPADGAASAKKRKRKSADGPRFPLPPELAGPYGLQLAGAVYGWPFEAIASATGVAAIDLPQDRRDRGGTALLKVLEAYGPDWLAKHWPLAMLGVCLVGDGIFAWRQWQAAQAPAVAVPRAVPPPAGSVVPDAPRPPGAPPPVYVAPVPS